MDWARLRYSIYVVIGCMITIVTMLGSAWFLAVHAPWVMPFIVFAMLVYMTYVTLEDKK